jgi:hypothetical protein
MIFMSEPLASIPTPTPPLMSFRQILVYASLPIILTGAFSLTTAYFSTKWQVNTIVTEEKQHIKNELGALVPQNPIIGEIRAFAFGGDRGDTRVAELRSLGWVECAGQFITDLKPATKELFEKLDKGHVWGKDERSGTIRLPDLRGVFLRGWSHGANEHGDPDIGARKLPPGRDKNNMDLNTVGTTQASAFQKHDHAEKIGKSDSTAPDGGNMGIAGRIMGSAQESDNLPEMAAFSRKDLWLA